MLSRFIQKTPIFIKRSSFAASSILRYNTMVATEQQQPKENNNNITISAEEQIRQAEITRDNLDIVKKYRADPEIVEYEAYSHSSASEKAHSLTASVSSGIFNGFNWAFLFICLLHDVLVDFERSWHAHCSSCHVL